MESARAKPKNVRTERSELGEAKLMALRPCSGWPVGCKAINLDFLASFSLVHFFWTSKRNEQKQKTKLFISIS